VEHGGRNWDGGEEKMGKKKGVYHLHMTDCIAIAVVVVNNN